MTNDADLLRELLDKRAVEEAHYRYAACLDRRDTDGLKDCFTAEATARYGNGDVLTGPDTIVDWINSDIHVYARQHHLLVAYHVEVEGDEARALIYHTSHQVRYDAPDAVQVLVCRYHTRLRREDRWRIDDLVFEVVWAESRTDVSGRLEAFGGAGPAATTLDFGGWGNALA